MKSLNITKAGKRHYDDACGAAHALELVGERWALLVMRELMFGARRFGDLRRGLPGISANVLAQRLAGLEAAGLIVRRRLPPPASAQVYELTPWGYEAEPMIQALGRWATRSPRHDPSLPLSAAALMLSFRTMLNAARAGGLERRVGFALGDESFVARLGQGRIVVDPRAAAPAEAGVAGSPETIAAAVYGGQPIRALEAAGVLTITGDRALTERFVTLFPLPDKAIPAAV